MSVALSQTPVEQEVDQTGAALGRDGPVPGGLARSSRLRPACSMPIRSRRRTAAGAIGRRKPAAEPATSRSTVSLSESKLKEAKITIEPARFDRIATGVPVVGLIQANSDRQVEVRPRAAGHRARGSCRAGPERQTRRPSGHARQPRDRHRPAEPPRQAARAVDRAVRGRLEVGDRRQRRPARSPSCAKGSTSAAAAVGR